jgi:hypothetical protein
VAAEETPQSTIFEKVGIPIADQWMKGKSILFIKDPFSRHPHLPTFLFLGYNGAIFAYGQTGSGKTYTVQGKHQEGAPVNTVHDHSGLTPRIVRYAFQKMQGAKRENPWLTLTLTGSYLEIYKEIIQDLLTPNKEIRIMLGTTVKKLIELKLENEKEAMEIYNTGKVPNPFLNTFFRN